MRLRLWFFAIGFLAGSGLAQETQIAIIDRQVAAIDSIPRHRDANYRVLCPKDKDSTGPTWITDTIDYRCDDTWYHLVWDSSGNLVFFAEVQAYSDESLQFSHYFRPDGSISKFQYYLGTFASECTEILRYTRDYYYSGNGELIYQACSFTDRDHKPIDTTGCNIVDWEYHRYATVKELKTALGL